MDYGVAMKTNEGDKGFQRLHGVLRVLILCSRTDAGRWQSNNYVQTIIFQLLLFNNAIAEELPTWKLLQQNFSMFNEEPGEMSFAVLGRAVLGDHVTNLLEHMNKRFLLVREHQQEDDALRADNGMTFKADNHWRRNWTVDAPEVQSARHFLSSRLREMTTAHFMVYPSHTAVPAAFLNKSVAAANMTTFHRTNRAWVSNISVPLALHLSKLSKFKSAWASSQPNKWPEFQPALLPAPPVLEPEEHAPGDDEEKEGAGDDWGDEVQDVLDIRPREGAPGSDEDAGDVELQELSGNSTEEVEEGYSTMEIEEGLLPNSLDGDESPLRKRHKNGKSAANPGKDKAKKKPKSKKVISAPDASSVDEKAGENVVDKFGRCG